MTEVSSWGVGRPDFHKDNISSKPIVVKSQNTQTQFQIQKQYTIGPASVAIDTIYTVETGYDLNLELGIVSVKDSCINKIEIFGPNSLTGSFRFDMRGDLSSALAGQVITAGTSLVVYIYNNDTITSNFSLTLSGMKNRVS